LECNNHPCYAGHIIALIMEKQFKQFVAKVLRIEENSLQFEAILHGNLERKNIWKVHAADGKRYAVKQFVVPLPVQHYSQLAVELNILKLLKRQGCPVPDVIATDETNQVIMLEWCGDMTLDDICQSGTDEYKKTYIRLAIEGFCQIEKTFSENIELVKPYVYPMDYQSHLHRTGKKLLESARRCISDLAWIRNEPLTESEGRIVNESWNEISHCILSRQPSLGTLDYNAKNIVIDPNRVSFIDFSKIGWDWSERRLMQYLTGLGAHKEGGNFVTLLNAKFTKLYAETKSMTDGNLDWKKLVALVDYHHILFYLTAITKLLSILKNPENRQNALLLQAWGTIELRLERALWALANESLSGDRTAALIRNLICSFLSATRNS